VKVKIFEHGYENLPPDIVTFKVIEPLYLYPEREVSILPKSSISFMLGIIRNEIHGQEIE